MPCTVFRDKHGAVWRVAAFDPKNVKAFVPVPHIDVWWDRDAKDRADELLMLRQENATDRTDVVVLTLGQVYDMIHALCCAVKDF